MTAEALEPEHRETALTLFASGANTRAIASALGVDLAAVNAAIVASDVTQPAPRRAWPKQR